MTELSDFNDLGAQLYVFEFAEAEFPTLTVLRSFCLEFLRLNGGKLLAKFVFIVKLSEKKVNIKFVFVLVHI